MGYRSDVTIIIYGPSGPFTQFKAEAERRFSRDCDESDYDEFKECFNKPNQFLLQAENRKWNEEYESVQFYESLFKLAVELGLDAEFIRIGEDSADIQVKYACPGHQHRLYVERRVIVDDRE